MQSNFVPLGTMAMSGDIFGYCNLGHGLCLRPGMQLHIWQCTQQPRKIPDALYVDSAKAEKPVGRHQALSIGWVDGFQSP